MAQAQFLPCRRQAARLGVFLALALLFAQTGAVMHQYSHLSASGESRGVPATSSQSCPACQSYAPVRKTERFKAFVRAAGLVEYWRARGWPDLCRPTTGDDFECE